MMIRTILILLLFATPAYAINVQSITQDEFGVTLTFKNQVKTYSWDQLGLFTVNQQNADALAAIIQEDLDTIIKRNTLPADDPDKASNPNLPHAFWQGGDIIYRNTLVTVTIETGEFNVRFETINID